MPVFGKSKAEMAALKKERDEAQANVMRLQAQLDEASEVIESAPTNADINKRVNKVLASIGVDTFANEFFAASADQSDKGIVARFMELEGDEKTEFYNKNKAAILRAMTA